MSKEWLGIKDINNIDICEGDILLIYRLQHKIIEENSNPFDEIPVKTVDINSPLPVADVPLAKGKVYWCEETLGWSLEILWTVWNPAPASIRLTRNCYALEILKDE